MSETKVVEKIKINFIINDFFFENHAVHEIMWVIKIQLDKPQMIKWFTRISYWIRKATNTHSEYVTHIPFRCKNGCFNVPKYYVIHTYIA